MRICSKVERVERLNDQTAIHTDGVEVRVRFVTDDIVRIRAGFDGGFDEASYSLVTTAWPDRLDEFMGDRRTRIEPAQARFTDGDDEAILQGDHLKVVIEKDPFRICVYDGDGTLLHADIVDLGYQEDSNRRRIHTSQIADDDCFYGFGEKSGIFNKAQKAMSMSPKDAMGYDPRETDSLYKHIPYYVKLNRGTRKAVGYFYHNTSECDFDMGREKSNYWPRHSRYRADAGDIDLFLIAGPTIREVVQRYTDLTGKSVMLPKTALGYLGSSMYYPELPKDADQAIVGFIDTTKSYDIPVDGFQLSSGYCETETTEGLKRCFFTWNDERFPDPERFFAEMTERGITVSPNVKPGILLVHPMMEQMQREGIFVKDAAGDKDALGTWWGGKAHFVDFTNEHAREVWKELLTEYVLDKGTSSVWNDNCEYESVIDKDARVSFDGAGGTIGHLKSVMPNLFCQITEDAIEEAFGNVRPFIVCRSGHAGIQRYAQTWAGDNRTGWDSLEYNIATILGMSLSGVANQGADIGGFYGPTPEPELFVRWVQNGIFQPRFSIHSVNTDNTVTEPWMYHEYTGYIRDAIQFRYRMFPYLYSLMARAHETGLPIMEPMCSAFQDDPACYDEGVDFMLGDSLLVANVVTKGATTRRVYLPADETFYDLATRERYLGGRAIEVPVELGTIPVFVRAGGIVPLADEQLTNLATQQVTKLHLLCAPDRDGQFTLYEDDGVSRDYESGIWHRMRIDMRAGEQTVLAFSNEGGYRSPIESVLLDVIHREKAPFWVKVDGVELPHFLNRRAFDEAESGWYYSQTLKSVQIKYPNPDADYEVVVSFEQFDMIGM
ncbi:TIM-barrel domain-containing protein [Propionimicrobium sp. PCR01-08-3]|uniref:glycoside hydrolase family 31 protein n=1 Tax=Propionimicrobium sp. PCR01-08-3 TaxID=3052086 RepID=UPI00255C69C8|nr:TIM-barrel domain-containing protein [Propionimicrobium sp. PCR01-08-3]WIY81788.1 glycoside hydrolase family 31 protein [Propionimicrobium sp. PCR01-08-3]